MAKKRSVAKSAAVERDLEASLAKLEAASKAGGVAVAARAKEAKRLATASKRLGRKRATLLRRKKTATKRAKARPSGETRGALRTAVRELASVRKEIAKTKGVKDANATELAALKAAHRRATAYLKAIARADRTLP